jgi:uncharacterized protein (TIGR03545 family)
MIRLKVFIPVVLIILLAVGTVLFYLEDWVKNKIENAISAITDTRTDITRLKISFSESSIKIKRLEIASSENEFKNAVEFEDIIIDLEALPLLKKRFVVDEFSVKGIQWGTKRSKSGKLPPKINIISQPTWFSEFKNEALDRIKTEFENLPVSQFTDFRIPSDPREILDRLDLKSAEAYKTVITHGQELKGQWVERISEIKDTRNLEAKIKEVRDLAKDVPASPQDVLVRVQKAQESIEFFKKEEQRVSHYVSDVKNDVQKIQSDYKTAVDAFEVDFSKAKSMISLDQLKLDNLSRLLFGPQALSKVHQVLRLHSMMRDLLASNTKEEDVQVRKRAKGRDIVFVAEKNEPSFILEKSDFSVKGVEGGDRSRLAQVYDLKLRAINSSPRIYGKPSTVEFKGQFKEGVLNEAQFNALWDYTTNKPIDDFKLDARKIKAEGWPMGIPNFFPLKIGSGVANASSELRFEGDKMHWVSKIEFADIAWNFSDVPRQGLITELLNHVFERIKNFSLEIKLKSENSDLDFDVSSDLDGIVKSAVQAEIQKKISEYQARLKQELENRVAKLQSEAQKIIKDFQSEFQDRAESSLKQVAGYQDEVGRIQDEIKKKGQRGAEEKLKDMIKGAPSGGDPLKKIKKLF